MNQQLIPNNVEATSVIQEGEMYTLEEAKYKDTGIFLEDWEVEYINLTPTMEWDIWINDNGSVLNPGGHIHFD